MLGTGDVFGEIALLERTPRTATVTAMTPAIVYAANPREFAVLMSRPVGGELVHPRQGGQPDGPTRPPERAAPQGAMTARSRPPPAGVSCERSSYAGQADRRQDRLRGPVRCRPQ